MERRPQVSALNNGVVRHETAGSVFLPVVFLLMLIVPYHISISIGPMRLTPYRITLILLILPIIASILSGRTGRLNIGDWLVFFHVLWAALALFVAHNFAVVWEAVGIYFIETLVPYWLARCYIRSAADLEKFVKYFVYTIFSLLPFLAYESITGNHLLLRLAGNTAIPEIGPRLGLTRVHGPFEHPIMHGTFCAALFGLIYYITSQRTYFFRLLFRCGTVFLATFLSLSSGPILAVLIQAGLIIWKKTIRIKHKWYLLSGLLLTMWIAVSLFATRSPLNVFVSFATLSPSTAYGRMLVFEYGSQEVLRHPIFGIGLNDWQRLRWMSDSVDNFWLLQAMRYGLPAFAFLLGAFIYLSVRAGRLVIDDPRIINCRNGWVTSLIGLGVTAVTVHYLNAVYVLFMFVLGCGIWLFKR